MVIDVTTFPDVQQVGYALANLLDNTSDPIIMMATAPVVAALGDAILNQRPADAGRVTFVVTTGPVVAIPQSLSVLAKPPPPPPPPASPDTHVPVTGKYSVAAGDYIFLSAPTIYLQGTIVYGQPS